MSAVLGIDVSSHAVDFVVLDENSNAAKWHHYDLGPGTAFERLRRVKERLPGMPHFDYDGIYLIAIERPRTRSFLSAAAQWPVFGAVIACLPSNVPVWDVDPTAWRKTLGLPGNATKEACAEAIRFLAVDHWRQNGDSDEEALGYAARFFTGDWPQDALDAYAVAYYARETNARGIAQAIA